MERQSPTMDNVESKKYTWGVHGLLPYSALQMPLSSDMVYAVGSNVALPIVTPIAYSGRYSVYM